MIASSEIYKRCKDLIRRCIGDDLHQIKNSAGEDIGAVFSSKQKRPTGAHPFVVVDIANRQQQNTWASSIFLNADGDRVITNTYDYFITFAFYGGDALALASAVQLKLATQESNEIFTVDAFGSIADTFNISSSTANVDNMNHDFASFIVKITILDSVVDEQASMAMEDICLDLTVRVDEEDEGLTTTIITTDTNT